MTLQQIINKHLLNRSLLSYCLYPASLLYALLIKIRRKCYTKRAFLCPDIKLICVGNISSGGTGKTPFVIFLAEYIKKQGFKPAVISRGYHGSFEHQNVIISNENGLLPEASSAGDEPYLIARHLKNCLVVVGKNRIKSIELILKQKEKPDVIIFDDAFQHVKVRYDLTFLVFNGEHPVGNGFNLPAGILREPLSHAKLADCLVYNAYEPVPAILNQFNKPVLRVHYQITRFTDIKGNIIIDFENKKIALLTAIGVPSAFEKTISQNNLSFFKHFSYPDHYAFEDMNEIRLLKQILQNEKVDYVICTEKDFSKLEKIKHDLPLVIACSEFRLAEDDFVLLDRALKTD